MRHANLYYLLLYWNSFTKRKPAASLAVVKGERTINMKIKLIVIAALALLLCATVPMAATAAPTKTTITVPVYLATFDETAMVWSVSSDPYYFDPNFWMGLFSTILVRALGEPFGTAVDNVLHQVYVIGTGLLGGYYNPYSPYW